ncbi:MAG: hypothetical protein L0Z73_06420 [Gammaproteobacteria bacterium]|nr:hypothetical protein [Gammaproteobacteria bacterium]
MTIGMQGAWTVAWKSKEAGWPQRFRIAGSSNGVDGVYGDGDSVFVTGDQWGVTAEHNPAGPEDWLPSRDRITGFQLIGGQFQFDIESDDTGGGPDADFDDLVLTCTSTPITDSEWLLYGTVKTYSGFCGFNPCFPFPYVVIDTREQLERILAYEDARNVIKKLYPQAVKTYLKRPFPLPDPPPFRPMLIPTGLSDATGLRVTANPKYEISRPKGEAKSKTAGSAVKVTQAAALERYVNTSSTALLTKEDLSVLGKIKDLVLVNCEVNPLAETLLRFQEYDRTATELTGGPYTGEGNRETLGTASTDFMGNYVFRFSRSVSELITEAGSDIATGEDAATAALPDIIVQIMESLPEGVAFETAPYYNVPNIKRINLCIPESQIEGVEKPCQGGRAIQYLGNISILPNPHSTLHSDGTITNLPTASGGPAILHGAWRGRIYVYGCFEDSDPVVTHYTLQYRHFSESTWHYVDELYEYDKKQGDGTFDKEKVGPFNMSLFVNGPGGAESIVPAYVNIETDENWAVSHRHRKIKLLTSRYQPEAGGVYFRIQGYDSTRNKVTGAYDLFPLYIDNVLSTGDIDFVKLVGETDPGECALIDLATATTPLQVRYRVRDAEGFLDSFNLKVYRGSNTPVGISGTPISGAYVDASPFRYHGTPDIPGADLDGYVEVTVTPVPDWLGGHGFCAFSFELWSDDRATDGYSTPGGRILWRELVGLSTIEEDGA